MATVHASTVLQIGLVFAPDSSLFFNRDGSISGKAYFNTVNSGGVPSGLSIGDAHPYDSSAFIAQYGYKFDEAGFVGADVDYVGVWSTTVNAVDSIATTQQEPIQVHPRFNSQLAGTYGVGNSRHGAQFDGNPTLPVGSPGYGSGEFICFPPTYVSGGSSVVNPLGGVTSYLNTGLTIRLTYTTTSSGTVTNSVQQIGKIQNSLTAGSITYTYPYAAWQCTNVTYKEIVIGIAGSIFSVTEEWLFTQPTQTADEDIGWNPLIYPVTTP